MQEYYPVLSRCPLFSGIRELPELLVSLSAQLRAYSKGEAIFLTGDPVTALGIVCAGEVQVVTEDFLGSRSITAHLSPGELFAESFALAGTPQLPVSVFAVTGAVVLLAGVDRLVSPSHQAFPFREQLTLNMLHILAGKNVQLNQKIQVLSGRSTREKLLAYLSAQQRLAGSASFTLPFNRQELADFLCVDRSAMSSQLGRLRDEGLLRFDRNKFTLLTPDFD